MVYSQSMIGAAGMTDCIAKVRRGDPPRGDEPLGPTTSRCELRPRNRRSIVQIMETRSEICTPTEPETDQISATEASGHAYNYS